MTDQQPICITISLPYCPSKYLMSYCEASLCPCYCIKHSMRFITSCVEKPCECSHTILMWQEWEVSGTNFTTLLLQKENTTHTIVKKIFTNWVINGKKRTKRNAKCSPKRCWMKSLVGIKILLYNTLGALCRVYSFRFQISRLFYLQNRTAMQKCAEILCVQQRPFQISAMIWVCTICDFVVYELVNCAACLNTHGKIYGRTLCLLLN